VIDACPYGEHAVAHASCGHGVTQPPCEIAS
jgi:hypothetical protein